MKQYLSILWGEVYDMHSFCWEKVDFPKNTARGKNNVPLPGGDDKNLGENFAWGHGWKCLVSIFWFANAFSSNLNTIDFPNRDGIYRFERKFKKKSG